MPKENTHLKFAHGLLEDFHGQDILRDISGHIWQYLLGSIIPDTFYYGGTDSLRRISESFHGKDGNPTNVTIVQVIDHARALSDIAFILGYVTHCALDITFHPVIYYLSGNYYDESPAKKAQAVYLHRHLETCLDRDIKNTMRFHRLIKTKHLKGLIFERIVADRFQVSVGSLRNCLCRQKLYNLIFTSPRAYRFAGLAAVSGLFKDTTQLGLFYADASSGEQMPSAIDALDLIDGSAKPTTVAELFLSARNLAKSMMEAAYGYRAGTVAREDMLRIIPGLSLDTGRLGMSASSIRYTKYERPQE